MPGGGLSRARGGKDIGRRASGPHGRAPLHVVQLLGGGSAGTGAHVRSLTAGLVARGLRVTVCAPAVAERRYGFTKAGARFLAVPDGSTPEAVRALRMACSDADLVHAHGMRSGFLAVLALRRRSTPLVVTWHARSTVEGARAPLRRMTEHWVAHDASVVLGATSDLVERARERGARDARLAPVALPAHRATGRGPGHRDTDPRSGPRNDPHKIRAELGAVDRPLLVTAARLLPGQGLEVLLTAARAWRWQSPQPLLVVVGEGPAREVFQRRVDQERLPVRLSDLASDLPRLLEVADMAVSAASWEARSPLVQEALRGGVPLVATAVGGVPELVGDAAVLVPFGDAGALGRAVTSLLGDADRRIALAEAGPARAGTWPTEDTTVAQVLSVYDELADSA